MGKSTETQLDEAIELGYLIRNGLDAVKTWVVERVLRLSICRRVR